MVRIITDKGTYYAAGVLQGYTATNVSVKATEKSATIRICNEKGMTVRIVNCPR
ncbi:MAG: hypothetical protein MR720_07100 [Sutterella sp.]|nr:hypothetical protein [Sutterella sp.]